MALKPAHGASASTSAPAGSSSPSGDDRLTVVCLHCNRPQDVSRRAVSITCKHCYKRLEVLDVSYKQYVAQRAVETCGIVTVEKRGNVVADRVHCGGLIVRGKVRGNVTSRGPVLVGPEAELKGDVTAPSLAVGAGAVLDGWYAIGKKHTDPGPPPANGNGEHKA